MKRLLLTVAIIATTLGASAQTTIGNVGTLTTVQGKDTKITSVYTTYLSGGLGGVQIGSSGKNTTIIGNSTNIQTTYTSLNSAQTFVNGEKTVFNQQGTITTINKTGISTAGTITGAQLFTGGMNVGNEIINLKDAVSLKASASSVVNLTNRVTSLENNKADKVQVASDIAQAKAEAKNYTDALETKVNTEVNRLDGRIDALDLKVDATNITVENNRIEAAKATSQVQSNLDTEVGRLDAKVDATNATVEANKLEAKNYTDAKVGELNSKTDKLNAKMLSEFKMMDTKVDSETNRLDSKIDRNDAAIRRDLRNETERSMKADAALFAEMSGLGATMMAMGSMQSSAVYSPTKRGNISMGSGVYRDSFAYAASVSYYVNPNVRVSSTVAGGTKTKVGGGLGVSFGF